MKTNTGGSLMKKLMLALGLFLALPAGAAVTQAQDRYWGQDDDRRERRQDRRERRRERREDRGERREDRRGRDWDRYDNYGGSFQLRQTALNAGYNNGIEEGRKDRRKNDRFDYRDESDYRNASKDYSSRLGDRGLYQRYFREGFANGYEDGFRNY
ncbi:MAG: hypothetical protein H0T45_10375 [Pyrinomonadaceae bacterium]|nr:hypothetical protein [Pyrinomonadaceae bacterium]MDQ3133291.1 hypothetical protein [Acidobacteriota bacterium]